MPFNEVKGWGALKRAGREIEPPGLSLSVSKQPPHGLLLQPNRSNVLLTSLPIGNKSLKTKGFMKEEGK